MNPTIENEQTTSTITIDTVGGWKVEHFTKTWDARTRLDAVPDELAKARADLAAAQQKVDDLTVQDTQAQTFIATQLTAAPTVVDATSTPPTA